MPGEGSHEHDVQASTERQPAALRLRQAPTPKPADPNDISTNPHHKIIFRHPGYSDDSYQNVLLTIPAFDHPEGGLHHSTALLACAIVAGNAWNGYLTETREGPKVDADVVEVLRGRTYYFWVPNDIDDEFSASPESSYKYPVFPSFEHWSFPHEGFPTTWLQVPSNDVNDGQSLPAASNLTAYIMARDKSCIVTDYQDCLERAHLCPRSENKWFHLNSMHVYNDNQHLPADWVLDDRSNAFLLRQDIHTTFDDRKFVIVPKQTQWVVHFLESTCNLLPMYHNTSVSLHKSVSPQFLLVRFAWAIFPLMRNFLKKMRTRKLRLRVLEGGRDFEIRDVEWPELEVLSAPNRPRSSSPKKRSRPDGTSAQDEIEDHYSKRRRTSDTYADARTEPPLGNSYDSRSSQSALLSPPMAPIGAEAEGGFLNLRRQILKAQRPKDPRLVCCDYNEAERESRLGLPGPKKHGGAHLCLECLGADYLDELPKLTPEDFE